MCCEEAGADKACLLAVPASSQHKAAPTKDASDERYWFSARQRSPKGWAISHRNIAAVESCAVPVGAGKPAKKP
ncbi:hypothetical protein KAM380_085080 [Aeromonas caviae]|nr:hypothetical protein KAM380_085080 [Aeromonas caviae]